MKEVINFILDVLYIEADTPLNIIIAGVIGFVILSKVKKYKYRFREEKYWLMAGVPFILFFVVTLFLIKNSNNPHPELYPTFYFWVIVMLPTFVFASFYRLPEFINERKRESEKKKQEEENKKRQEEYEAQRKIDEERRDEERKRKEEEEIKRQERLKQLKKEKDEKIKKFEETLNKLQDF